MTERLDRAIDFAKVRTPTHPFLSACPPEIIRTFARALIADLLEGMDGPLKDQEQPGLAAAFNGGRISVVAELLEMIGLEPPELPEDLKRWADNIIRNRAGIGGE